MKNSKLSMSFAVCGLLLIAFLMLYSALAFPVFQWRNPKAKEMTYYTEFGNVITFQRMEKYQ